MNGAELTFTEMVSPYLPFAGVVLGGLIVGGFAAYNRRKGNQEVKVPTVAEAWGEVRLLKADLAALERKYRNLIELFDALKALFRGYVERIRRGGSRRLTAAEQAALSLPEVSDEDYPTITPQQLDELRSNS